MKFGAPHGFSNRLPTRGMVRLLLASVLVSGALLAQSAWAQNAPAPAAPGPLDAPALIPAACVPVDGMTFELAGSEALLMRKGEEAQAIIHVSMFLPAGIHALQFPADSLCPGGAKSHFMVNNDLYTVHRIRLFNNA
ncbi:MAG TPA: hypothetical protein VLA31_00695, partial [Burkholderiaceae bacterium]|nr:hypothetical protein [Burkholderiaceae bacterium]